MGWSGAVELALEAFAQEFAGAGEGDADGGWTPSEQTRDFARGMFVAIEQVDDAPRLRSELFEAEGQEGPSLIVFEGFDGGAGDEGVEGEVRKAFGLPSEGGLGFEHLKPGDLECPGEKIGVEVEFEGLALHDEEGFLEDVVCGVVVG